MALFNQCSKNENRFFFATAEGGEQDLFISTISSPPFTDFFVGITGNGSQVQINQMPDVIGTATCGGEELLYGGTASTYKTLSSLSVTATGLSMSIDRTSGSGVACIESYGTNGSVGGFEFLSRGINSELVSTIADVALSNAGFPGATAALTKDGSLILSEVNAPTINNYKYPEEVVIVPGQAFSPGALTIPADTVTTILTLSNVPLTPGNLYLTDFNLTLTITPTSEESFIELGIRLGGNGTFNYGNSVYVPVAGTFGKQVEFSINEIGDMGSSSQNVDIVAYIVNTSNTDTTITPLLKTSQDQFFKNIT